MKITQPHIPYLVKLGLLCLSLLCVPIQSYARDVSFTWTANPEPLTGYKLYYKTGTESGLPYDGTGLNAEGSPILLDKVTTAQVTGLSPDENYQFTLTAYNDAGESDYSTVVHISPLSMLSPTINSMSPN